MEKWECQIIPCYLENCLVRELCKWRTACIFRISNKNLFWQDQNKQQVWWKKIEICENKIRESIWWADHNLSIKSRGLGLPHPKFRRLCQHYVASAKPIWRQRKKPLSINLSYDVRPLCHIYTRLAKNGFPVFFVGLSSKLQNLSRL